jgi:PAS domain S-box-containing protein
MPPRILIVEDSATQAMALCMVLESQQFLVDRVASGEEALAFLQTSAVDIVLSDIVMPGMSGYTLCERIKAVPATANLPVVLLTSLGDPLDIVRGLECGADNYVTKPYEPEYLCARIRNVLDRQLLRRAPKASLGVNVSFLGTTFSINSEKEQILDLFISSVEDVVRTNRALQESQSELAAAQARLEEYAHGMYRQAQISTEKYAALMHQASDAIAVLDVEGRIVEANVQATELLGMPMHQLCGHPLADFATPDCAPRLTQALAGLREVPRVTADLDFVHATGRIATCGFSASRTNSEHWDLVLVILHDVTDVRNATNRAHASQAKLAQAQQVAAVGSWERNLVTGASEWSDETCRILGIPQQAASARGNLFLESVHPDDRAAAVDALRRAEREGRAIDIEVKVVRKDRATRVVHVRGEAVYDARRVRVALLGTLQDVTEQRLLETQLRQAQKMEAVGQLAGGVAHDFNNLLTVITSYSVMLISELPIDSPIRADIQEIAAAAARAETLTRQLLAFSRQQVLQPQSVDVGALALGLRTLLRRLVREDIEIVTVIDPATGVAWADPGQIEQVLVNLVVNARDAMPEGGTITLTTAACEHASAGAPPSPHVLIKVADTGLGIPPEVQARMFEPFYTTKEAGKGTGLGLSTVYGIVRQSGGDIVVDSTVGIGTTFRIYLPIGTVTHQPKHSTGQYRIAPTTGETVLVVEDDDALRTAICRILRKQGYQVLEVRNGREALDLCAQQTVPIHLVLSDIVMPEMSGHELAQQMAALHPETSLLLMSGYNREAVTHNGITASSAGFLQKPFTPESLAAKVREVLDGVPLEFVL